MQKKLWTRFAILAGFAIALASCNNGLSTTAPSQLNPGAMTADVSDGSLFTSSYSTSAADNGNYFSVSGIQDVPGDPADEITMTLPKSNVVPFTVTEADGNFELHYYDAVLGRDYAAFQGQGSFTITITSLSPTIEGAFQGTLIFPGAIDSVRVLSNGRFNAPFN
jgi:hypothetical protein